LLLGGPRTLEQIHAKEGGGCKSSDELVLVLETQEVGSIDVIDEQGTFSTKKLGRKFSNKHIRYTLLFVGKIFLEHHKTFFANLQI
jgi:hypothetical protein